MLKTELQIIGGARKRSCVYVMTGARPDPLLGDKEAEGLVIIMFHPEERTEEEETTRHTSRGRRKNPLAKGPGSSEGFPTHIAANNISIPAKLRMTGIIVSTE